MQRSADFDPAWLVTLSATPTSDDITTQLAALDEIQRWAASFPLGKDSDEEAE